MSPDGAPLAFPDGFRWGVAYAAHQVEGGNWNSDWWDFEHTPDSGCAEPSGDACDSWHRWPEDLALVEQLGFGDFRFSVEWARIEPEDGEFSQVALDHYRTMCVAIRDRGIQPVVTLYHFTLPRWFATLGGWESDESPQRFARYCDRVLSELGDVAARICTLNEPNVIGMMGYVMGMFPPGRANDMAAYRRVTDNLLEAHRLAVQATRRHAPGVPVGLTLSMTDYQLAEGGERMFDEIVATEDVFLDITGDDDFIGAQAYTRMVIGPSGWAGPQPGVPTLIMGYEYWPEALEGTIRRAVARTGRAPPGPGDRERHRHRRRRPADGLRRACPARRAASDRRRHRRRRLHVLVAARQLRMGRGVRTTLWHRVGRPADLRQGDQGEWSLARGGGPGQRPRTPSPRVDALSGLAPVAVSGRR